MTVTGTGRRLRPDQRRGQLLEIGARFFATRPYAEVSMEQIGAVAGVSRALVYRYFPNKRELFAAIYRDAASGLLARTEPDPSRPMTEWVAAGLDAHIDYYLANQHTVLTANRGPLSGDPVIQSIISEELGVLRQRMLDSTGFEGHQREIASVALLAWLNFVRAICVDWLQHPTISRGELRDVSQAALVGVLDSVRATAPGGVAAGVR